MDARTLKVLSLILPFLLLSFGCCALLVPPARPDVSITAAYVAGPAPFYPSLQIGCDDPTAHQLSTCSLAVDGQVFATASNADDLIAQLNTYPQVYRNAMSQIGDHKVEIVGTTTDGVTNNASITIIVEPGPILPNPPTVDTGQPPVADLQFLYTSGPSPFVPIIKTYSCYSPQGEQVSCSFKIDGQTVGADEGANPNPFAHAGSYWSLFDNFSKQQGRHTLEIDVTDLESRTVSKVVPITIEAPFPEADMRTGNTAYDGTCQAFDQAYCDNIVPTDLLVRQAAAAAIAKHPGPYSVNQLFDIYDYVFDNVPYQNVPVDLTYQPYPPDETLATKSGDCKNQAVLLASMVEAIGGTARVLLIPGCGHAYTEVYVGNASTAADIMAASGARYPTYEQPRFHTDADGLWMAFDTAGGRYPGQTLPECNYVDTIYLVYNCNRPLTVGPAPESDNTEYGPFYVSNKPEVIEPGTWSYNYYTDRPQLRTFGYCKFNFDFTSLSQQPLSWYIIPEDQFANFSSSFNGGGTTFNSFFREENVMHGHDQFDWTDSENQFMTIVYNRGSSEITVQPNVSATCYG